MGQSLSLSSSFPVSLLPTQRRPNSQSTPETSDRNRLRNDIPQNTPSISDPLSASNADESFRISTASASTSGQTILEEIEVSRISHRDSASSQLSSRLAMKRHQIGSPMNGNDETNVVGESSEKLAPKKWVLRFPVDVILEFRNGTRAILVRNQELELYDMSVIRIDISDTQLEQIPDMVFELESLEILVLSRNRIRNIPDSIGRLSRLRKLVCDSNSLEQITPAIGQLKQLEFVDFTHNRIHQLPDDICQLSNLQCLGVSDCRLECFPADIGSLTRLQKLGAFNNQLRSLPPSIGQLRCLQKLDLSRNQLQRLPSEIGMLISLAWLNLSHNELEELPELDMLQELKEIGLGHNRLTRLPDLSSLKKLCILPVYCNKLTEICDWIVDMPALTKVDFSCNAVTHVPPAIFSLKNLSYLNLKRNKLDRLECQFIRPPFLTLRENTFQSGASLSFLCVLDISENQLQSIPFDMKSLQLKSFRVHGNPWSQASAVASIKPEAAVPSLKQLIANCILDHLYHLAWAQDFRKARYIFEQLIRSKLECLPELLRQFCADYKVCSFCHHPYTGDSSVLLEHFPVNSTEVPYERHFCTWTCMHRYMTGKSARCCRYLANSQLTSISSNSSVVPLKQRNGNGDDVVEWITPNSSSPRKQIQNFVNSLNALMS